MAEQITCPGCNETVQLDWADGWRNDNGLTCEPASTTHSDHILPVDDRSGDNG